MLLCGYTRAYAHIHTHTHTHTVTWIGALSCVLCSQDPNKWEVNLTRYTHAHTHAYRHLDWRPVLCAPLPRLHHVVQGWGWRLLDPGAIQESQGRPLTATPDCCPLYLPHKECTLNSDRGVGTKVLTRLRCLSRNPASAAQTLVVALKIGCNEAAPGIVGVGNRASGACIYICQF